MKFLSKVFILCVSISLVSCVGDLDFDQVTDLEIDNSWAVSVLDFGYSNDVTVTGLPTIQNHTQVQEVLAPEISDFVRDHLERVVFSYTSTNSFDASFTLDIVLTDQNDNPIYALDPITIPISGANEVTGTQEVNLAQNPGIIDAYKAIGTLTFNGDLDLSVPSTITFESGGIFYLDIDFD